MRAIKCVIVIFIVLKIMVSSAASPIAGFALPDSIRELKLKFKLKGNLIVLPVVINDSIHVNLLLDTGCRNLVLFGKKFMSLLKTDPDRIIRFSGHGEGTPVEGRISFNNKVAISEILGNDLPLVVVREKNVFAEYPDVHGVIGYELFLKFEIEINWQKKEMIFRPAMLSQPQEGFYTIPLEIVDSKPVMTSVITFGKKKKHYRTIIDTGSYLGLFVNGYDADVIFHNEKQVIGRGLNGDIEGYTMLPEKFSVADFALEGIRANVVESRKENQYASIGMEVIRDYVIVLNYTRAYVSFRKNSA